VQIIAESKNSPTVYRAANLVVIDGGAIQANIGDSGNLTTTSTGKIAVYYNKNQFAYSFNANTVQTDATGTVSASMNRLVIGSGAGVNSLNGTVSKIMYYAKVITTSETEILTRQ